MKEQTLAQKVMNSSALLVALKLIHRSLGLVSTIILARLLTPADFGLVALVSITVYFFDVLSSAGSDQYIIRRAEVSRDDLDTAWTIDLLMKLTLWLLLEAIAPWFAQFFGEPRLSNALRVGACVLPINALASARLNLLKQGFEYRGIFALSIAQRLLTFALVILLAYMLRSYWAMIISDIAASLFFTLGSYGVARHRPRLTLTCATEQWAFSGWLLLKSVVGYTRSQIDTFFISKLFPATTLGQYQLAREIVMLPAHTLIAPASDPLVALFRHSRESPERLAQDLRLAQLATALVVFPIVGFLICFPSPVISVLLGSQWAEAGAMIQALSLLLLYFSFFVLYEQALIAVGQVSVLFTLDVTGLLLIVIGLLGVTGASPSEIGLTRGAIGTLNLILMVWVAHRMLRLQAATPYIGFAITSVAAATAGTTTLMTGIIATRESNDLANLLLGGGLYAAIYLLGIFIYFVTSSLQDTNGDAAKLLARGAAGWPAKKTQKASM
ncbi:MAG: oligosaccharide flippase family protein [Pseudohaliea sp.]